MSVPTELATTVKGKKRLAIAIEHLVLSIAESLYKTRPQLKSYGASSNGVWDLHFHGKRDDRVIKIGLEAPMSLMREQLIAQKLYKLGLAVPEIEFTQQDLPSVWLPFMVMPKVTETTLKQASLDDLPYAIAGCHQAGKFLAQLSQIPLNVIDLQPNFSLMPEDSQKGFCSDSFDLKRWQKIIANLKQLQVLTPPIREILTQVKAIIDRHDYPNIIHQDFIPRQILIGPQKFAAIDWETAAPGRTFLDMGDFLGSIRRSLRKKENRHEYARAFIDGFGNSQSLSTTDLSEIALWEAYSHIRAAIEQGHRNKRDKTLRLLGFATEAFSINTGISNIIGIQT